MIICSPKMSQVSACDLQLITTSLSTVISWFTIPINNLLINFRTGKFNFCTRNSSQSCTRNDWFLHRKFLMSFYE